MEGCVNFTIEGYSKITKFSKIFSCLHKIGTSQYIEFYKEKICFKTFNGDQSVFISINLYKEFFSDYSYISKENKIMIFNLDSFKVFNYLKTFNLYYKLSFSYSESIENIFVFNLESVGNSLRKTCKMFVQPEFEKLEVDFDIGSLKNNISMNILGFKNVMEVFSGYEHISILLSNDYVKISNWSKESQNTNSLINLEDGKDYQDKLFDFVDSKKIVFYYNELYCIVDLVGYFGKKKNYIEMYFKDDETPVILKYRNKIDENCVFEIEMISMFVEKDDEVFEEESLEN